MAAAALNPETRAWMLERLSEGDNWNTGRTMFLGLVVGAMLPLVDVAAGRNELTQAAMQGCADSPYALGRAGGHQPERAESRIVRGRLLRLV